MSDLGLLWPSCLLYYLFITSDTLVTAGMFVLKVAIFLKKGKL